MLFPPSVVNRSITTLLLLTKPGRLSSEIEMLPRKGCWLSRMLFAAKFPVLPSPMLSAQRPSLAMMIVLLITMLLVAPAAASIRYKEIPLAWLLYNRLLRIIDDCTPSPLIPDPPAFPL